MHSPGELGAGSTFFYTLPIISTIAPQLDLSLPPMAHSDVVVLLADRAEAADRLYPFLHERGFEVQLCRIDETDNVPSNYIQMHRLLSGRTSTTSNLSQVVRYCQSLGRTSPV